MYKSQYDNDMYNVPYQGQAQNMKYCSLRECYVDKLRVCSECPHRRTTCRAMDIRNGNPW